MRPALIALVALLMVASLNSTATAETSVVRIPLKGPGQVSDLEARGVEIVHLDPLRGHFDAIVNDEQLAYLQRRNYPVSTLAFIDDIPQQSRPFGPDYDGYHTYLETDTALTLLATNFPNIVDDFVMGTSLEGRAIRGIKISDNPTVDEAEAEVLIMSNLHAREIMTVEVTLGLAEYLCANYGSDAFVTEMVDNREIFIIPMLNPDGHVYVEDNNGGSSFGWWRKNRRNNGDGSFGVDLNRNFGFLWGFDNVGSSPNPSSLTYRGTGPFSEPETAALEAFVDSREFTIWLSYHSYGELLLYPWGYDYLYTDDHKVFQKLGEIFTATNGYLAGNPASGAIYTTNGGSDDWGYADTASRNKIFAFTPEINSAGQGGFGPVDTMIAATVSLNLDMNLKVIEYAENPYRVVGPWVPANTTISAPFAPIHTVAWDGPNPEDPNPAVAYDVEVCIDPQKTPDAAEAANANLTFDGFSVSAANPNSGINSYYSGMGDNLRQLITFDRPFTVDASCDTLTLWVDYEIETDWDYAYVTVSTDGGCIFTPIAGSITTNSNPNGSNVGNGITGFSGGYVEGIFPLTAFLGQEVIVQIQYITDAFVVESGIFVDDISFVPSCGTISTTQHVGVTQTQFVPDQIGTHCYRVRGIDAEDDAGDWSPAIYYDVATISSADVAKVTQLGRNYPNPFNPITTIPYRLAETGRVNLSIYSVSGALVATLVDDVKQVGDHSAVWRGADASGRPASSGVYFYRLAVAGKVIESRKLVLLK